MKDLFERYEQQSQEVEKVLEKSIELVRDRKSPDQDLCSRIDAALRDLRSVYDEITERLPEKIGVTAAPAEASVKELESLWQESVVVKQNSLKAVLSEFIRVYSDEDRYLKAIEEQLELARNLLIVVEKNENANPDVTPYKLFLDCVKQDLDENEDLSNMLEDEGIDGFSGRAIGGLQKKKYYIRDEESVEEPAAEESISEEPTPVEEAEAAQEEPAAKAEESAAATVVEAEKTAPAEEPEPGVLGYVDTVNGRVKVKILQDTPDSAAHASKYISKARDRIGQMVFALNILTQIHMFPAEKLDANLQILELMSKTDLEYLLARGYVGKIAFERNGETEEYYVPSSMAYACMRKTDVSRFILSKLKKKDQFPESSDLVSTRLWSAEFAYRCKLLVDYLLDVDDEYMIYIHRGEQLKEWAYCSYPPIKGVCYTVAAGILSKEQENEELEMLTDFIQDPVTKLLVVVDSPAAILPFVEKLSACCQIDQERVRFAVSNDPQNLYDTDGVLILEADEIESAEDLKEHLDSAKQAAGETVKENAPAETAAPVEEEAPVQVDEPEPVAEMVSPLQPLKSADKLPSKKDFDSIIGGHAPLSLMLCRNLACLQVASLDMIKSFSKGAFKPAEFALVKFEQILDMWVNKGYLAAYELDYLGDKLRLYCQTELLRKCLQKDDYRQSIAKREKTREKLPFATFVAKEHVDRAELIARYEKARLVIRMYEYEGNMLSFLPNARCWWFEEKGLHQATLKFADRNEAVTYIVPCGEDGKLEYPSGNDNLLVVSMQDALPDVSTVPVSEGRRVFCITEKAIFELVAGKWINLIDLPEEESVADEVEAQEEAEPIAAEEQEAPEAVESAEEPESVEESSQEQEDIPTFKILVDDSALVEQQPVLSSAYDAFTRGKLYAGMTILHGLEEEDEAYHRLVEQYGFAVGDPYLEQDNRFANLQSVYKAPFGEEAKYDLLACAAYLRMYCSPTAAYDPYSINDLAFLKDNMACSAFKPLNDLLNDIAHYVGRFQHGLDDRAIEAAVLKKTQLDRIADCSRKAKEIQNAELYKQTRPNKRIKKTRMQLLGEGSDLQAMLSIVAEDKRSEAKKIKAYLKDIGIGEIIEDDAIDDVIQSAWNDNADVAKEKKADPLGGAEKSCLSRQLREIFECLIDWTDEVDPGNKQKGSETQDTFNLIQKCRNYLIAALQQIQKQPIANLQPEEAASYVILEKTLDLIKDRFEGIITQERYRRNFYIDLLKAPYVALDDERMPIIESKNDQIYDLDFCKRVAQYVVVPDRPWNEVVKKIFTYSGDRECFNFGCAEIIRKYLEEIGQSEKFGEYNTEKMIAGLSSPAREKQSPSKWREDFIARFEMAKSDEWFSMDAIHTIEEKIQAQEALYYRANNFGIYGRALLRMTEYFNEMAQKKKPDLQHRLDMLKEKYEEIESWPIIRVIQESIDKLRFGVADSYLVQAERGNFDIVEDNQQPESKLFNDFLANYESYYRHARPESGLTLEEAFEQSHPNDGSEDYKTAITFLKYWPKKGKTAATTNVDTMLRSLGLDKMVDKVNYKSKEDYYLVKFDEKQEYNPAHPIAKFGSQMYEKGLQVAVVSGSAELEDLVNDIPDQLRKLSKDIPALIIVDAAIHKDVRRQLARKFMSSLTLVSFIILDRVMALRIANERKAARWTRLLNYAVPFQPINPYSDDPTKEIPNEMFFGREEELRKILSTETAMLVFGGRQLGKTALLHHARNLSRDVNQGHWASYVDVKDKKVADAATKIGDTLVTNPRERFLVGTKRSNWTWNVLVSAIRDRLFVGEENTERFFLFIDEADAFLKDSAKRNYKELDDLLQLSTDTNYRFRFVLAGLRDVVQFHREANANNSIVSKFKRLRIPPLEFLDARKLLVIPLSYLGFTFSDEEGDVIAQILHSTNYFPGIIHFYAHKLVEQIHKSINASSAPSFELKRDNLLLLLKDKEFRDLRKDRLEITLKLDDQEEKYYYTLALLLSYYNSNEKTEGRGEYYSQYGVTVQGLLKCARDIDSTAKISRLTESQMTTVLEELVELYILRKTSDEDGVEYYDFARTAFADMLGRKDEVQTKLINLMAEGGHEDE